MFSLKSTLLGATSLALIALLPSEGYAQTHALRSSDITAALGFPPASATALTNEINRALGVEGALVPLTSPRIPTGNANAALGAAVIGSDGTLSAQTVTPPGASTYRTLGAAFSDVRNAIFYRADPTGAVDSTGFINNALAADSNALYHNVYLPPGNYHTTSSLTDHAGQCLLGDGKSQTTISIGYDYSPTAGSPIILSGNGFGTPCVKDIAITFAQPSSIGPRSNFATLSAGCGTNGKGCKYPPAIDLTATVNPVLSEVHIGNAWDCVYANWTGSQGVIEISNLTCGAFDRGLDLRNASGVAQVHNYHFFPWNMSPANNTSVYQDGGTFAAVLTGMQGFTADNFFSQSGRVQILQGLTTDWEHFSNLEMDGGATFEANSVGGWTTVVGGYSTGCALGSNTNAQFGVTGSNVYVTSHEFISSCPMGAISNGWLSIANSQISGGDPTKSFVSQTGGTLTLTGDTLSIGAPAAWSVPLVQSTGGITKLVSNAFGDNGGGSTGVAVSLTSDSLESQVVSNTYYPGFTFVPPGQNGSYEGSIGRRGYVALTPADGARSVVNGRINRILVNPATAINSFTLTVNADGTSIPGDVFTILCTQPIASLDLYSGGAVHIATVNNIAAGRIVTVWNVAGTLYAGVS